MTGPWTVRNISKLDCSLIERLEFLNSISVHAQESSVLDGSPEVLVAGNQWNLIFITRLIHSSSHIQKSYIRYICPEDFLVSNTNLLAHRLCLCPLSPILYEPNGELKATIQ